jgi:hypothetical protein
MWGMGGRGSHGWERKRGSELCVIAGLARVIILIIFLLGILDSDKSTRELRNFLFFPE